MILERQAEARNFSLPVDNSTATIPVQITNGKDFLRLNISPAPPESAAFVAEYDIPLTGEDIRIQAEERFFRYLRWGRPARKADAPAGLRPAFHFAPAQGWLNDPNGLYWRDGEWHLFFQYNPFSANWNNMHWSHAVSSDLIHWRETGPVLFPDSLGTMFSGSAVIDHENASGFGAGSILLYYTNCGYDGRGTQNLAVSTDGGKSFRKYEKNPILPNFTGKCDRDPQVAFDPESGLWRMCLFLGDEVKREFLLFASHDLLHWEKTDSYFIPGGRECPGLLRLRDEVSGDWKWIFTEANGLYRVGTITRDGKAHFESDSRTFLLGDAYAGQCFHNTPDGRAIFLAWLRMPGGAGGSWAGCMTLPLELRLSRNCLLVRPAAETATLPSTRIAAGESLTLSAGNDDRRIVFNATEHAVRCQDRTWAFPPEIEQLRGRCFTDRFSVEYFDDSERFMAAFHVLPPHPDRA